MLKTASLLISVMLGVSASSALAPSSVLLSQWQPQTGDVLLVDTQENVGYLFHKDGAYVAFPVVTGQRRSVRYIGLTYNATTPEGTWVIRSKNIQPDRITYGPRGEFLRMYENGKEWTHYGVHTHVDAENMLAGAADDRFRSMGCIIVSDYVFKIIEKTYDVNDGQLAMTTKYGFEHGLLAMRRRKS